MSEHLPVRATDPDTSYEAAVKAVMGASKIRPIVLELVRTYGPLTHDELIGQYNRTSVLHPDTPRASDSGIRTRLAELVEAGLIEPDDEKGKSRFGNKAKRWRAVDPDTLVVHRFGRAVAAQAATRAAQTVEPFGDSDGAVDTASAEDAEQH